LAKVTFGSAEPDPVTLIDCETLPEGAAEQPFAFAESPDQEGEPEHPASRSAAEATRTIGSGLRTDDSLLGLGCWMLAGRAMNSSV
jgi:hypothetical protein